MKVTKETSLSATGKLGTLKADYWDIVKMFGEPLPMEYGDGKVRASWVIEMDGVKVCVHDYRDSHIPISGVKYWSVNAKKREHASEFVNKFNEELQYKEIFG